MVLRREGRVCNQPAEKSVRFRGGKKTETAVFDLAQLPGNIREVVFYADIFGDLTVYEMDCFTTKRQVPEMDAAFRQLSPEEKIARIQASATWELPAAALKSSDRNVRTAPASA